jgi:ssRNA-specific RNase YbeY (16S rRNA maturation enzyme)
MKNTSEYLMYLTMSIKKRDISAFKIMLYIESSSKINVHKYMYTQKKKLTNLVSLKINRK